MNKNDKITKSVHVNAVLFTNCNFTRTEIQIVLIKDIFAAQRFAFR